MKKQLVIGMTLLASLTLVACSNSSTKSNGKSDTTSSAAQTYKFKGSTLKTPDEKIKIIDVTTTPSINNDSDVAVVKYEYTNKRSKSYDPETALLDRTHITQRLNSKSSKDLTIVGAVASSDYDSLRHTDGQKVKSGKTQTFVAFFSIEKNNYPTLRISFTNAKQEIVGHKDFKLTLNTFSSSSSAASESATSTDTQSSNTQASNSQQSSGPQFNSGVQISSDPWIADQDQWELENGYVDANGNPTANGQAADSEVEANMDPNDTGDPDGY